MVRLPYGRLLHSDIYKVSSLGLIGDSGLFEYVQESTEPSCWRIHVQNQESWFEKAASLNCKGSYAAVSSLCYHEWVKSK